MQFMSYRVVCSLLLTAAGLFGGPADSADIPERASAASLSVAPGQPQLLEKARAANTDLYSSLKSFVCREEIQRYKGDIKGSKTRVVDHVSANLSFENGLEHYSDIHQNNHTRPSLSALNGAWSEGEFGTLLQQTGQLLEIQPVRFVSFDTMEGKSAAIFRFEVSEKESPWDLEVSAQHYNLSFTTDVWISVNNGAIIKIARKSIGIPAETGISEIDWDVTLAPVDLNGSSWLLPTSAGYSVTYAESSRREWNQMSFSTYHRYGAESELRFDAVR